MKRTGYKHRKMKRLAAILGIEVAHAHGLAEGLWHTTERQARAGDVGAKFTDDELAEEIGSKISPKSLVSAFADAGLLDRCKVHRLLVHDWPEHCDRTTHKYMKENGLQFAACDRQGGKCCCKKSAPSAHPVRTQDAPSAPCLALPLPKPLPEPCHVSAGGGGRTHTTALESVVGGAEALESVERWAEASRGTRLEPVRNELQRLEGQCLEVWAIGTPIVHAGHPVYPLVLVPEAVRRIMARASPPRFKSVPFAIACIDGELDEMRRFGTKTPTGIPDRNAPPPPAHDYAAILGSPGT